MPVVQDRQDIGWEDTRGEQGRIRTRDSGDAIVIPWRTLQFYSSTTGTGTGTSYQAGGFNEAVAGFGSALLISVGDDAAGSGIAVRMLIWGSIFGVAIQSKISDTEQPPVICTGVDRHYRRHYTVDRALYYRNKRVAVGTFDDYATQIIHADDLDPAYPHLCELIIPGDRAQATVSRQFRGWGIIVSRRAGYAQPDRASRLYAYSLAQRSTPFASSDRLKRGDGTSRDGTNVRAVLLNNTDDIARTVLLNVGGVEAYKVNLAAASAGETARGRIPIDGPLAPSNDTYLYVGEANNTLPVVATVVTGA